MQKTEKENSLAYVNGMAATSSASLVVTLGNP
jgi:hypothetical protein